MLTCERVLEPARHLRMPHSSGFSNSIFRGAPVLVWCVGVPGRDSRRGVSMLRACMGCGRAMVRVVGRGIVGAQGLRPGWIVFR